VANRANIGADTESAPINGSFSLIKSFNLKSAGKTLYEGNDIHKVIFIKNLLDFSDDFSRSVAKNQFWYLDSDATTVTDGNVTNVGMRARALLSHGGATVHTIILLNRYSFFEGLSDRVLPPMQLEFEIVLQDNREMIFQNDGTAQRIVVRRLELWMPQLQFTGQGQTLVNENFLRPPQWKYLKEVLHLSSSQRDAKGTWLITPGVKHPKHVFIILQQTRKKNSYTQNPYIFLTHLISTVITPQDQPLVAFSDFTLSSITTMTLNKNFECFNQFQIQKERLQHRRSAAAGQLPGVIPNYLL